MKGCALCRIAFMVIVKTRDSSLSDHRKPVPCCLTSDMNEMRRKDSQKGKNIKGKTGVYRCSACICQRMP